MAKKHPEPASAAQEYDPDACRSHRSSMRVSRMYRSIVWCFISAFAGAIAGCQATSSTRLDSALENYFGDTVPQHTVVFADLNGNGMDDAIVYASARDWCGSGGCTLFVFLAARSGYSFLSKTTIVQLPIRLLDTADTTWKSLIVSTRGIGPVVLAGSARGYPGNPSLQRAASTAEIASAVTLLDYD